MTAAPLRVLVADDSAELRSVIRALLEREGMTVVDEAADGAHALDCAARLHPQVVVLDAAMPGPAAESVIAGLAVIDPAPAVVVYSGWPIAELGSLGVPVVSKSGDPERLVQEVVRAGRARADG